MKNWEIDKLIAVKILGCSETPSIWFKDYDTSKLYYFVGGSPESEEVSLIEYYMDGWDQYHFSPSTNITDAWKIVDKLKQEDQYYFRLENGDLYDYECMFSDFEDNYYAEADTPELAICKAALKTKGIII